MKLAVHRTFINTEPTDEGLGNDLKKAFNHQAIRRKFESVNDDLKQLGIDKIVLETDSVQFVGMFWVFDEQ